MSFLLFQPERRSIFYLIYDFQEFIFLILFERQNISFKENLIFYTKYKMETTSIQKTEINRSYSPWLRSELFFPARGGAAHKSAKAQGRKSAKDARTL